MTKVGKHDIAAIAMQFKVEGRLSAVEKYGSGHINDTYAATYDKEGDLVRYIHQRINHHVFKDPVAQMSNIQRVTDHINRKLELDPVFRDAHTTLVIVPAHDDEPYYQDESGNYWRTYQFIEQTRSYDVIESTRQAYQAAKTFGRFQRLLLDFSGPRLHEVIPGFHNTPRRVRNLQAAVNEDPFGRAAAVQPDIEFAMERSWMAPVLIELHDKGLIPERITHNDTKLNNVLLHEETGEGYCVIDLDTVMPGLSLYDFGDMVRSSTCLAAEDEQNLDLVRMELPLFEALTKGYLSEACDFLVPEEIDHLVFSGKLMTYETGIRFLTDYLQGDEYFKTEREGQNVDRCRTQFALLKSMEEQTLKAEEVVHKSIEECMSRSNIGEAL